MNMRTQQIMQEFYTLHPDLTFLEAELSKSAPATFGYLSLWRETPDLRKWRQQR